MSAEEKIRLRSFPHAEVDGGLRKSDAARKIEIRCDPLCQRSAFKKIVLGLVETQILATQNRDLAPT